MGGRILGPLVLNLWAFYKNYQMKSCTNTLNIFPSVPPPAEMDGSDHDIHEPQKRILQSECRMAKSKEDDGELADREEERRNDLYPCVPCSHPHTRI